MATRRLPMFPLGTVLFPSGVLPLRIFEPRYRKMLEDLLLGSREFGVVLIERGSEVGGGEVRSGIGTMARVPVLEDLGMLELGLEPPKCISAPLAGGDRLHPETLHPPQHFFW